jgi:hypothetical protein
LDADSQTASAHPDRATQGDGHRTLTFPEEPGNSIPPAPKIWTEKGDRQLDAKVDAQIEAAIDDVYLKREQPTLRKAARNCRAARLIPPSMKALRARVSARGLRERMKAREGAEAAGDSTSGCGSHQAVHPTWSRSPIGITSGRDHSTPITLAFRDILLVLGRTSLPLFESRSVAGFDRKVSAGLRAI